MVSLLESVIVDPAMSMSCSKLSGRFPARKLFFIILIILVLLFVCGTLQLLTNTTTATREKDVFDTTAKDENGNNLASDDVKRAGLQCAPERLHAASGERVIVIVFGHGRSGTSFLGQLFNQNPAVLYHFEPLKVVERMGTKRRIDMLNYRSTQTMEYLENAIGVLSAIFRCNFSESSKTISRFLELYSKANFLRNQSQALRKLKSLYYLAAEKLNELCRARPKYTVVKLLIPRLPGGNIVNLLPLIRTFNQSHFKFIHIVRDPRGAIASQASLNWFGNNTFEHAANTMCRQTRKNLHAVKLQDAFFQCNYKHITYERLVTKPRIVAQELYRFIGMNSSLEVEKWIERVTNPTQEDIAHGKMSQFSQIRNATLVLTKWKSASRARNAIVERECEDVMQEMGYKKLLT